MKELLKVELYKALSNKMFIISTVISTAVAVGSVLQRFLYESAYFNTVNSSYYNPSYEIDTLYNQWIGAEGGSVFYYIFYIMIPVFSAFAYSWSYADEEKNGYLRQMTIKGNRGDYIFAKYISVFISGGLVTFIALLINIALCATYFPVITPDVYYDVYYGIGLRNAFGDLFYSIPDVYMLIYVIITCLYSGLFAVFSMVCSYFIKNKYIVMFIPFFLCIFLTYISNVMGLRVQIVPTSFLHPGATVGAKTYEYIILGELFFGILLTLVVSIYRGKKNDVF